MTMTSGIVEGSSVKIDPNRICWVAPVVALLVVSR
jgi:preprotein translocase subunit Sec61beta